MDQGMMFVERYRESVALHVDGLKSLQGNTSRTGGNSQLESWIVDGDSLKRMED
jgi:hypothetical protein